MTGIATVGESALASLGLWQILAIAAGFVWSGFVRSGLGFGGAAMTLPLLLAVHNDVLLYLPAICWQLLFFSLLTVATRLAYVNWSFLFRLVMLLAVPFAAGLFGLLNLSETVLAVFVYTVTLIYGTLYLLNKVMVSSNRLMDAMCLLTGGYVSGVSMIGAPMIVAYSTRRLPASQLRDTLFVLWIILVIGKLGTFVVADVDLQWQLSILTLPLAGLGHWMGLAAHQRLIAGDRQRFNSFIGAGLCTVSLLGLGSVL